MTGTGPAELDHKPIIRGTAMLMVGNVVGQMIALLGLLVLARIYGPTSLGLWSTFVAYGAIIPFFAGFHYDLGIVIADNERDAVRMAILAILVTALVTFAFLVASQLFFLLHNTMDWGILRDPGRWSQLALGYVPYTLGFGVYNAAIAWGMRNRSFLWMMCTRISIPSVTFILQYALQNYTFMDNGLIFGTVVTFVILFVWSAWFLHKPLIDLFRSGEPIWSRVKTLAIEQHGYPLYAVPRSIIFNCMSQLMIIVVGLFHTMAVVGAFSMAYRAMYAPMVLLGTSLGQALFPSLSEFKSSMHKVEEQITVALRFIGWAYMPVMAFILLYGRETFSLVFGQKWEMAGFYAGYLTMALFGSAITLWLERIFDIMNRQKLHLVLAVVLNLFSIAAYMFTYWLTRDADKMIFVWSASMLAYAVIWLSVVYHICGFRQRSLICVWLEFTALALALTLGATWCAELDSFTARLASFAALFSAYGVVLWLALHKKLDGYFVRRKAPAIVNDPEAARV